MEASYITLTLNLSLLLSFVSCFVLEVGFVSLRMSGWVSGKLGEDEKYFTTTEIRE